MWPTSSTGACGIRDLRWPYPPQRVEAKKLWNQLDEAGLSQLAAAETCVVDAIRDAVLPFLGRGARVVDVACSHGSLLAALAMARPDLALFGRDLAPGMVRHARRGAPDAEIEQGDASDLGGLQVDAAISRALAHQVMPRAEALVVLAEMARVTATGGLLVVCSLSPPLVHRGDLDAYGSMLSSVSVSPFGALRPCYVVRRERRMGA